MPTRPQRVSSILRPPTRLPSWMQVGRTARQDAYSGLQPAPSTVRASAQTDPVMRRVHAQLTVHLRQLIRPLRDTLQWAGCGPSSNFRRFESAIEQVLAPLTQADGRVPQAIRLTRGGDGREALIAHVLQSFGVGDQVAALVAHQRVTGSAGRRSPGRQLTNEPTPRELMRVMYAHGCRLDDRLANLQRQTYASYAGGEAGENQTLGLLATFPDIADVVYRAAGLARISRFPPTLQSRAPSDSEIFLAAVRRWTSHRRTTEALQTAGLVIAGLAVSVISFGTMSALGATLVSCGFAVSVGVADIARQRARYQQARDGERIGATSAQTVQYRASALSGAWQRLVIDAISMGALSRLGGAGNVSRVQQFLRVRIVEGAAAAASAATDPDVRRGGRVAGVLVFATVLSIVGGGVSDAAVTRLLARVRAGARVQIVTVQGNALQPGAPVRIAAGPTEAPVGAVVTEVGSGSLRLRFEDGADVRVRVDQRGHIEVGDPGQVQSIATRWRDAHARWGGRNPSVSARAAADVRVIGPRTVQGIHYVEIEFGPEAPLLRVQDAADLDMDTVERYARILQREGWTAALAEQPAIAMRNGDAFVLRNGHHRDAAVQLAQQRGSQVRMRALVRDTSSDLLLANLTKARDVYGGR